MFFIIWPLLAFAVGSLAVFWKRNGTGYFLLSLLISPLGGLLVLLARGDNNRKCPACMKSCHPKAIVCSGCGREIPPQFAQNSAHGSNAILNLIDGTSERKRTAIVFISAVFLIFLLPRILHKDPVEQIRLPVVTLGNFSSDDQARLCGEILGRTVSCGFRLNKAIGVFSFCRSGIDGSDQNLSFKAGIEFGKDNASGWSCDQIEMASRIHEIQNEYITERLGNEFIEYID